MQESLKFLNYKPESVSPEQFQSWRNNPCTLELKQELVRGFIDLMETALPESTDNLAAYVHQREGYRLTAESILSWEPTSVRTLRERSRDGVIEEVDND